MSDSSQVPGPVGDVSKMDILMYEYSKKMVGSGYVVKLREASRKMRIGAMLLDVLATRVVYADEFVDACADVEVAIEDVREVLRAVQSPTLESEE